MADPRVPLDPHLRSRLLNWSRPHPEERSVLCPWAVVLLVDLSLSGPGACLSSGSLERRAHLVERVVRRCCSGGSGSDVELSEHVCPYPLVDAPNYGGRVPVDTTSGPVPVYRALKNPLHPNATTESCQNHQEPRISQQQQL